MMRWLSLSTKLMSAKDYSTLLIMLLTTSADFIDFAESLQNPEIVSKLSEIMFVGKYIYLHI